jgi:hypothetical protein
LRGVAEFKECVSALLLLLLAMQVQHRQINVVQQLCVVLDAIAARKEDDDFLLQVALEEGEEQQKALV